VIEGYRYEDVKQHVGYAARVKPRFRYEGDNREVFLEMSVHSARAVVEALDQWLPLESSISGRAVLQALHSLDVRPVDTAGEREEAR
jgi:hypothetical protein